MYKHLITGGCSFTSEVTMVSWPTFVGESLDLSVTNLGTNSIGNTFIARRVITAVDHFLTKYRPEELLVGINWSGPDRIHKFYGQDKPKLPCGDYYSENPSYMFFNGALEWEIGNSHWENDFCDNYYRYVHTTPDAITNTIDNILLVQNYLSGKKVKYFMFTYLNIFKYNHLLPQDVINYFNLIDFSTFADLEGEWEWCMNNQKNGEYTDPAGEDNHPYSYGHKEYVNTIILPFIKTRL